MNDKPDRPFLTTHVATPWHVRMPPVFRYLEQEWIDRFFETGELRVSTFSTMAAHDNVARRDDEEGFATVQVMGNPGFAQVKMSRGSDAYMLCGSVLEEDRLMDAFGVDGYFRIDSTTEFGVAVGRRLGFLAGFEGCCEYVDQRILVGTYPFTPETLLTEERKVRVDELARMTDKVGGPQMYFLKSREFANQAEYRFVWLVNYEVERPLIIKCPEARRFCSKVT